MEADLRSRRGRGCNGKRGASGPVSCLHGIGDPLAGVPLRGESPAAAQRLWGRYMEQLVRLASARLGGSPRRATDEEDLALVTFEGFLEGMRERRSGSRFRQRRALMRDAR